MTDRLAIRTDDTPRFRVAVAGVGSFSQRVLIPGLVATPGVEVVGLFGPTLAKVSDIAARNGVGASFDDFRRMLDETRPDSVVVATPNDVHHAMVLEAVERGMHVLCEKPLGVTFAEAEEMARAAEVAGVRTAVNFTYRSTVPFKHLWTLVQAGRVGRLRHFAISFQQGIRADPTAPIAFRMLRERGGGALLDVGIHMVDALRWLAGEVVAVSGAARTVVTMRPDAAGGTAIARVTADDTASFVACLEGGATGTVQVSQVAYGRASYRRIELSGDEGTAVLEEERGEPATVRLAPASTGRFAVVPTPFDIDLPFDEFPRAHAIRIVRRLRGLPPVQGDDAWPGFADGVAAQRVVDAVERSSSGAGWVATHADGGRR